MFFRPFHEKWSCYRWLEAIVCWVFPNLVHVDDLQMYDMHLNHQFYVDRCAQWKRLHEGYADDEIPY